MVHPNIVKVVDVFAGPQSATIIMEHGGEDLATLYRRLPQIDTPSILSQCLAALQKLHQEHVVHNDVKPPNIFVDSRGWVKLGDLGHAFVNRACQYPMRRGTRWYMAPEALLGAGTYGPPADIWSIGCVMAELALKAAPFQGRDNGAAGMID